MASDNPPDPESKTQHMLLACVASVSVGFGRKESQRNGIFGVFPA